MTPIPAHHTDWLLIVLIMAVALVLAARLYNRSRFKAFVGMPFHAKRIEIENSFNPILGRGFFDICLSLLSFLILALSVFLLLHPYEDAPPLFTDWRMFLRLFFILVFFFVFKNFIGLFVGWVFGKTEEIARAQNTGLAYRAWLSLLLLPLCFIAVYFSQAYIVIYYVLLFSLIIGYGFSFQFAFVRIWKMEVFPYYKIFYLCALEITPLIFLVGWLVSLD